jgi:hypothetical protein
VGDGRKVTSGLTSDPLGRGVRGDQIGEGLLQGDQTAIETVVFAVGDLRLCHQIIEVIVPLDRPPEGLNLGFGLNPAQGLGWGIEVHFFLGQGRLQGTSGTTDQTLKGNVVE